MSNGDLNEVKPDPGGPDMMVNIGSLRCAQTGPLRPGESIRWIVLDKNFEAVKEFYVLPIEWKGPPRREAYSPIKGTDGKTGRVMFELPEGRLEIRLKFAIYVVGPLGNVYTSEDAYLVIQGK